MTMESSSGLCVNYFVPVCVRILNIFNNIYREVLVLFAISFPCLVQCVVRVFEQDYFVYFCKFPNVRNCGSFS